jgi:hypothetical protein
MITFLAITGAVALATAYTGISFGHDDFWDHHGVLFLVLITLFPRLTLLFSSVAAGGLVWWLGWIFFPRYLVAILATLAYWNHNPILVVASWLIAIGGESSEKYVVVRGTRRGWEGRQGFESAKWVEPE